MPSAGVLFLLGGLALAGIPPTNGFISKLSLFQSGIQAEEYASLSILAIASLLTMIYIVRAFQRIWWQTPEEGLVTKPKGDQLIAPALLILLCLVLGIWGEPLIQLAQSTAEWMLAPSEYIQAVLGV